jgi:hypothetical protein
MGFQPDCTGTVNIKFKDLSEFFNQTVLVGFNLFICQAEYC